MSELLRIGGQAFGDGVLMRSNAYWAFAREDGSVLYGRHLSLLEKYPRLNIFFVRSIVAIVDPLLFLVKMRRRLSISNGARAAFWISGYIIVILSLAFSIDAWVQETFLLDAAFLFVSFGAALFTIERAMPGSVWSYHGAEHKAVNAYECGFDLSSTGEMQRCSRIHPRCGTNIVAILFIFSFLGLFIDAAPSFAFNTAFSVLSIGLAVEIFRRVSKTPGARIARILLSGGMLLQRFVTTREPSDAQLEVAARALVTVLALHKGLLGIDGFQNEPQDSVLVG